MKNWPLAVQIWLVCAGTTICLFIMIAIFLPFMLRSFFTRQVFDILKESQNTAVSYTGITPIYPLASGDDSYGDQSGGFLQSTPLFEIRNNAARQGDQNDTTSKSDGLLGLVTNGRGIPVRHVYFYKDQVPKTSSLLPAPYLQLVEKDALQQKATYQEHSGKVDQVTIFYVVRKILINGQEGFLVSYSWDTYRNDLVSSMKYQMMGLLVLLIVLSWLPSIWLARYMTRPLVQMEARIAGIAERDWHEPFVLDRRDEIGRLASSFETMRQRLVRQDEAQQKFLQHVSHELKTPVMVIHSYTQSILDGIYPKGDLAGSVDVINEESQRLEKRIRDLLYLTKFNYLTGRPQLVSSFDLGGLVKERVERFRWRRSDLDWKLLLPQVKVNGDPEQWGVAVENVLDNQLRYASSLVDISLKAEGGKARLRLWNDGPEIDPDTMSRLFQQYQTGDGGEFGLGLSIVKQTASNHGARVWADNEEGGVAFYIEMEITKALT